METTENNKAPDTLDLKEPIKAPKILPTYNSNPFTLGFDALGRFFNTNTPWAIVLIVLSFVGLIGQFGNSVMQSANQQKATTFSQSPALSSSSSSDATTIIALVVFIGVFVLLLSVIIGVIAIFVKGMLSHVALESEKGNSVSFSEAFQAVTKRFWRLLGAELLAYVKIFGWFLLFIVPGIVAAYRYTLLSYVIMDEPEDAKGVTAAHTRVKVLVQHRLLEVFGISTVGAIIPVIGQLISLSGNAALYRQMQIYTDNNLEKPKKHWLNYLGLILVGFFVLLIVLLGLVLIAVSSSRI